MLSPDVSQPLRAQGRRKKGAKAGLPRRNSGNSLSTSRHPKPGANGRPDYSAARQSRHEEPPPWPARASRSARPDTRRSARPPRFLSGLAGTASTSGSFRSAVCARGAPVRRGWPCVAGRRGPKSAGRLGRGGPGRAAAGRAGGGFRVLLAGRGAHRQAQAGGRRNPRDGRPEAASHGSKCQSGPGRRPFPSAACPVAHQRRRPRLLPGSRLGEWRARRLLGPAAYWPCDPRLSRRFLPAEEAGWRAAPLRPLGGRGTAAPPSLIRKGEPSSVDPQPEVVHQDKRKGPLTASASASRSSSPAGAASIRAGVAPRVPEPGEGSRRDPPLRLLHRRPRSLARHLLRPPSLLRRRCGAAAVRPIGAGGGGRGGAARRPPEVSPTGESLSGPPKRAASAPLPSPSARSPSHRGRAQSRAETPPSLPPPASAKTRRWPRRGAFPSGCPPPPLPGRGLRIPACLSRSPAGPSAKAGGEGEQESACAIRVGVTEDPPESTPADQSSLLPHCWPPMHSLDEPLDLKLSVSKLPAVREKRDWALGSTKGRALSQISEDEGYLVAGPGSPPEGLQPHPQCQDKRDHRFSSPPTVDLSLSPSPPGRDTPPSGNTSASPDRQSSGGLVNCASLRDLQSLRYLESLRSSFQFFLPLNSGGSLHLPASTFLAPPKEKRLALETAVQKQLVCHWSKCNQLFELLQDLVDHVNDFHVKPEKDAGYRCHWEGCARHGRGFNARYKMLIHIRTHTNEKPHRCPTCNKSFSRLENLKIHNRSHTGEKPYLCPYEGCSKRYSNSSDRFKHTRTHYVDKPYHCKMPGCHKRYTDPSSLRKHIKAHGHFITREQQELLKLQPPTKAPPLMANGPYLGGAQIIVPTPAALFGSHSLPLPLSQAPLDLSTLACGGLGTAAIAGLPSPTLAPLNLAKNPLLTSPFSVGSLGLPVVSLLAGTSAKAAVERGQESRARPFKGDTGDSRRCKETSERVKLARLRTTTDSLSLLPGGVLDLSTGMNSGATAETLPPGWMVIPAGSVLLKEAVVS